jgi:hypothetical protein
VSRILEQHGTPVYERDWENFIPDMRHITCLLLKKWDGRRGLVKIFALDNALRLLNTGAKKQAWQARLEKKARGSSLEVNSGDNSSGCRWRSRSDADIWQAERAVATESVSQRRFRLFAMRKMFSWTPTHA